MACPGCGAVYAGRRSVLGMNERTFLGFDHDRTESMMIRHHEVIRFQLKRIGGGYGGSIDGSPMKTMTWNVQSGAQSSPRSDRSCWGATATATATAKLSSATTVSHNRTLLNGFERLSSSLHLVRRRGVSSSKVGQLVGSNSISNNKNNNNKSTRSMLRFSSSNRRWSSSKFGREEGDEESGSQFMIWPRGQEGRFVWIDSRGYNSRSDRTVPACFHAEANGNDKSADSTGQTGISSDQGKERTKGKNDSDAMEDSLNKEEERDGGEPFEGGEDRSGRSTAARTRGGGGGGQIVDPVAESASDQGTKEDTSSDGSDVSSASPDEQEPPRTSPAGDRGTRQRKSWFSNFWINPRELGALVLQISALIVLMRTLRPGLGMSRQGEKRGDGHVAMAYQSVPFSDFLRRVDANDVQSVDIDGVHLTFSLRREAMAANEGGGGAKTMEKRDVETRTVRGGEMGVVKKVEEEKGVEKGDVRVLGGGDEAEKEGIVKGKGSGKENVQLRKVIYSTTRPNDMATPYQRMIDNGVEFGAPDKRGFKHIVSFSIGLLYIGLIASIIGRFPLKFPQRTTGKLRNRRGSSSKSGDGEQGGSVMFADVAGVDEAKEELEEIVEFLRNPERYSRLGARPPRGVLLVGVPGTGKTMLAKAVAGEADVPFISCSASEFVELYVGMGAARVRDLFARAKKEAPSIVFIDEIDAVAKGRDARLRSVGNDEREQTLNQLLTELDGFDTKDSVIVIAATNRADILDSALRRPGRFDRIVAVEPPNRLGREAILKVHVRKKGLPLAGNVDLSLVAAATSGFTGADLANLVNEAALLAGRANKTVVAKEEFNQAVERAVAGIEKKRTSLHRTERGVVARHEVGHAVVGTAVANLLPEQPRVEKLSIVPRTGGALGFTYIPQGAEDRYLIFVDEMRGHLVTLLGGRAAEEVCYGGRISTGALDDIKRATDVAYKAVAEYGLNSSVGPLSMATLAGGGLDESGNVGLTWGKDQGGHLGDLVEKEVKAFLQTALKVAKVVIGANPKVLEGLGALLEAEERLEGEKLQQWLSLVIAPMELVAYIKGGDFPADTFSSESEAKQP